MFLCHSCLVIQLSGRQLRQQFVLQLLCLLLELEGGTCGSQGGAAASTRSALHASQWRWLKRRSREFEGGTLPADNMAAARMRTTQEAKSLTQGETQKTGTEVASTHASRFFRAAAPAAAPPAALSAKEAQASLP